MYRCTGLLFYTVSTVASLVGRRWCILCCTKHVHYCTKPIHFHTKHVRLRTKLERVAPGSAVPPNLCRLLCSLLCLVFLPPQGFLPPGMQPLGTPHKSPKRGSSFGTDIPMITILGKTVCTLSMSVCLVVTPTHSCC